ncbi:MAG: UbiA family prenyltransferase [Gammaproteobacteria bacterium]|nr:UbiA family prenyltransferase [Gammaproteobacteria bacterium]
MDASKETFIDNPLPLCVDMDGTLLRTDSLIEQAWQSLYRHPFIFIITLFSLLSGLAKFKQKLAALNRDNLIPLPVNENFFAYLKSQCQRGRKIYLVTASDASIANKIAEQLKIFSGVIASNGKINLKGKNKAHKLLQKFGEKKFSYAGNAHADMAIWPFAKEAIIVNAKKPLIAKVKKSHRSPMLFDNRKNRLLMLFKAIRVHQWPKNLLLFLPLIVGHLYTSRNHCQIALLAFISFCLAAASAYLLNDLVDLATDRQHHSKKHRVLAQGDLPLIHALLFCPLFFVAAIFTAYYTIGTHFLLALISYYGLTLSYSFFLKKQRLLDIFSLSALYTIRIIAGIIAISALFSPWLISFSVFFFLSLALVKRYNELYLLNSLKKHHMADKMYNVQDMATLKTFGINAGYISVMVLALYINSPAVVPLYQHPLWLWGLIVLTLFWLTRIWLMASKGEADEDPVIFALKDKMSWLIALFSLLFFYMAS